MDDPLRTKPRELIDQLGGVSARPLAHFHSSEILVARAELENASGALGKLRGFLPHRLPEWFEPRPIDFPCRPFGPFPHSLALTDTGDVHLVSTPGHTPGHLSVAVEEDDRVLFLAGDTSYTEDLMLRGVVDGVAPDPSAAALALGRTRELAVQRPTCTCRRTTRTLVSGLLRDRSRPCRPISRYVFSFRGGPGSVLA